MNLFFDTSALIKRYILEKGSDEVDELLNRADGVFLSPLTEVETCSVFRRLWTDKAIDEKEYTLLRKEFETDCQYYTFIPLDEQVLWQAKRVIHEHQLKTLDSLQLGTALSLGNTIEHFVACDEKLIKAGMKEDLGIISPEG